MDLSHILLGFSLKILQF